MVSAMLGAMRDRRVIIEFALLMILLTVLGAVARSVLPDVHQLLRFALVVAITVAVWLAARAVLARFESR
jgi:hypothetical protein